MPPASPANPHGPPKGRPRVRGLRGINTVGGACAAALARVSSSGGPEWIGLDTLVFLAAALGLLVVLPVVWLAVAACRLRGRPGLAWFVFPALVAAYWAGPLRDWPLAARVSLNEAGLDAAAAEVLASAPRASGDRWLTMHRRVGPFFILHGRATGSGVYLCLARSPDGERGL